MKTERNFDHPRWLLRLSYLRRLSRRTQNEVAGPTVRSVRAEVSAVRQHTQRAFPRHPSKLSKVRPLTAPCHPIPQQPGAERLVEDKVWDTLKMRLTRIGVV
jgi:hypothetical protein